MNAAQRSRLLRETAVDLIRSSDLKPELGILGIERAYRDLDQIRVSYRAELRLTATGRSVLAEVRAA